MVGPLPCQPIYLVNYFVGLACRRLILQDVPADAPGHRDAKD